jgi:hypothetical protein
MTPNAPLDEITTAAKALGAQVVSTYTDEEVCNLRTILRWGELYNADPARMVTECYAPNCTVEVKGAFTYHGHNTFVALEKGVHQVAPNRHGSAERLIAVADTVVCQGVITDPARGAGWSTMFCAVLTLVDGKIVRDETYLDLSQWPSPLLTGKAITQLGLELKRPLPALAVVAVPAVLVRVISTTWHRLRRRRIGTV